MAQACGAVQACCALEMPPADAGADLAFTVAASGSLFSQGPRTLLVDFPGLMGAASCFLQLRPKPRCKVSPPVCAKGCPMKDLRYQYGGMSSSLVTALSILQAVYTKLQVLLFEEWVLQCGSWKIRKGTAQTHFAPAVSCCIHSAAQHRYYLLCPLCVSQSKDAQVAFFCYYPMTLLRLPFTLAQ